LCAGAWTAPAYGQDPPPPDPIEQQAEAESPARRPVFTSQIQVLAEFSQLGRRRDSPFNPQNQIAGLAGRQVLMEVRPDFAVRYGRVELALSPRAHVGRLFDAGRGTTGGEGADDASLHKWRVQAQVTPALSLSYGRQVVQWGNGVFRSVSNPFIADNGRLNPIREVEAAEFAIVRYTPSLRYAVSLLSNTAGGRSGGGSDRFRATHAVKFDYVGDALNATVAGSKQVGDGVRLGAAYTYTASQALLLYGEASGTLGSDAYFPAPAPNGVGWDLVRRHAGSERFFFANLFGASFTFRNGVVLTAEYINNNEGYTGDDARAFTSLATHATAALRDGGPGAGEGGRLLGRTFETGLRFERRNYAFVQLLRTEYRNRADLAVSYAASLDGGGGTASSYVTYNVTDRSQAYFVGAYNVGGAQTELARLQRYAFISGVRWFF
jgi:hypothetical protein